MPISGIRARSRPLLESIFRSEKALLSQFMVPVIKCMGLSNKVAGQPLCAPILSRDLILPLSKPIDSCCRIQGSCSLPPASWWIPCAPSLILPTLVRTSAVAFGQRGVESTPQRTSTSKLSPMPGGHKEYPGYLGYPGYWFKYGHFHAPFIRASLLQTQ